MRRHKIQGTYIKAAIAATHAKLQLAAYRKGLAAAARKTAAAMRQGKPCVSFTKGIEWIPDILGVTMSTSVQTSMTYCDTKSTGTQTPPPLRTFNIKVQTTDLIQTSTAATQCKPEPNYTQPTSIMNRILSEVSRKSKEPTSLFSSDSEQVKKNDIDLNTDLTGQQSDLEVPNEDHIPSPKFEPHQVAASVQIKKSHEVHNIELWILPDEQRPKDNSQMPKMLNHHPPSPPEGTLEVSTVSKVEQEKSLQQAPTESATETAQVAFSSPSKSQLQSNKETSQAWKKTIKRAKACTQAFSSHVDQDGWVAFRQSMIKNYGTTTAAVTQLVPQGRVVSKYKFKHTKELI